MSRHYLYALRFLVVFSVFITLWSSMGDRWGGLYRAGATWAIEGVGGTGQARVTEVSPPVAWQDTRVELINAEHLERRRPPTARFQVSSRYTGYLDVTFLLALVLATPMTLRRRALAVPAALFLGVGFALLRLRVAAIYVADHNRALDLVALEGFTKQVNDVFFESFVADNLEAGLVFAIVAWAAISFPR